MMLTCPPSSLAATMSRDRENKVSLKHRLFMVEVASADHLSARLGCHHTAAMQNAEFCMYDFKKKIIAHLSIPVPDPIYPRRGSRGAGTRLFV